MSFELGPNQLAFIEMLETTDIPQGRTCLTSIDPTTKEVKGMCCLGVHAHMTNQKSQIRVNYISYGADEADIFATQETVDMLKLKTDIGSGNIFTDDWNISKFSGYSSLTQLNDTMMDEKHVFTFKDIAQALRQFPHIFFEETA